MLDSKSDKLLHLFIVIDGKVLVRKNSFPCSKLRDSDAYSSVLTGARIMINKLGNSDIRKFTVNKNYESIVNWNTMDEPDKGLIPNEYIGLDLKLFQNPFFYCWQNYFHDAPIWNDDSEKNLVFIVDLQQQDLQHINAEYELVKLEELGNYQLKAKSKYLLDELKLVQVYKNKEHNQYKRVYTFIGFKTQLTNKFSKGKGFLPTSSFYFGLYRRKLEKWYRYNGPSDEFPTDDILSQSHCLVLSGSSVSSYDDYEWIRKTEKLIVHAYKEFPKLKFLPICFGLQVTVQAFGGKVEPMEQRKNNKLFYHFGNENLKMNVAELKKVVDGQIQINEECNLNVAHGDNIGDTPDMFQVLSSSQNCQKEILYSKDGRIFGYQGHPEFSSCQQLIFSGQMLTSRLEKPYDVIFQDFKFSDKFRYKNDEVHSQMCKYFMKK